MTNDGAFSATIDSATLFRRYAPFVASFLARQGAPRGEIEDLVQEVFLAAHRKGGYRPGVASPTTFLARLALECNLTRSRRALRRRSLAAEVAVMRETQASPEAAGTFSEERAARALQQILNQMKPELRAVFILFELEGESCGSIAVGLDVPIGTVYSRLHSAREVFERAASHYQEAGGQKTRASTSSSLHAPSKERP